MDGLQKRLKGSVRSRLSIGVSIGILAVASLAAGFSFIAARAEALELQDDMLRQIGSMFDRGRITLPASEAEMVLQDSDDDSRVVVQRLATGVDGHRLALAADLPEGLRTVSVSGHDWRVLVVKTSEVERIAVAQDIGFRDEIALNSALRTLVPFLVLVPVLLWVVAVLVRTAFRPIEGMADEIDHRAESDLSAVDEAQFPGEIRAFGVALNRLLARTAASVEGQRRFVADAAHELRSPMTALSLQAEGLARAEMSNEARGRLLQLSAGIERSRLLLEQMLILARVQGDLHAPETAVDVGGVLRRVLEDLVPVAEARQVELSVRFDSDVSLIAHELDLATLIKNLVDNAIRYSPPGGVVEIAALQNAGEICLSVRDQGPGIPREERARVLEPFYRIVGAEGLGSGLGLSIVAAIAQRLGARLQLGEADPVMHRGLLVRVVMPVG